MLFIIFTGNYLTFANNKNNHNNPTNRIRKLKPKSKTKPKNASKAKPTHKTKKNVPSEIHLEWTMMKWWLNECIAYWLHVRHTDWPSENGYTRTLTHWVKSKNNTLGTREYSCINRKKNMENNWNTKYGTRSYLLTKFYVMANNWTILKTKNNVVIYS